MWSKKLFTSVFISDKKSINYLYSLAVIGLVVLFTKFGTELGSTFISYLMGLLDPTWVQTILFLVDPLFLTLLSFGCVAILVLLWVYLVERRSIVGLGFFRKKAGVEFLKGLLIGSVMMISVVGLLFITKNIHLEGTYFNSDNLLNLLIIFPFWLLQSGTEELVTRGWLLPVLSRRVALPVGIAVSSLLFAALHLENPSVSWIALLNIALFGLFASLYILKTDNIWGVAAIHASWNCLQGSFFGLPVSGLEVAYSPMRFSIILEPDWLSGGQFGPEGSLLASLVLLVGIIWIAIALKREHRPKIERTGYSIVQF